MRKELSRVRPDQFVLNVVSCYLLRQGLLVGLGRGQLLHRVVQAFRFRKRCVLDLAGQLLGVLAEGGEGCLLMPQIAALPRRVHPWPSVANFSTRTLPRQPLFCELGKPDETMRRRLPHPMQRH